MLRDNRGLSGLLEVTVLIYIFVMTLAFFITFMGVYAKYNLINSAAHELARYVEIKGVIDGGTYDEFERLKTATGIPDLTVTFDRSGQLQLEEPFTIRVSMTQRYGIGSVKVIPVEVRAIATGRSEVYWK